MVHVGMYRNVLCTSYMYDILHERTSAHGVEPIEKLDSCSQKPTPLDGPSSQPPRWRRRLPGPMASVRKGVSPGLMARVNMFATQTDDDHSHPGMRRAPSPRRAVSPRLRERVDSFDRENRRNGDRRAPTRKPTEPSPFAQPAVHGGKDVRLFDREPPPANPWAREVPLIASVTAADLEMPQMMKSSAIVQPGAHTEPKKHEPKQVGVEPLPKINTSIDVRSPPPPHDSPLFSASEPVRRALRPLVPTTHRLRLRSPSSAPRSPSGSGWPT